jgi:hypothetical protein
MEDQLKRVVEDRQFEPDADPRNEPRGLETPNSDQFQAGTSCLIMPNIRGNGPLDSTSTMLPWYREIQALEDPVELKIISAPVICAAEARKAIKLLRVTPKRKYPCIW